jgi:sporadic carbohydrate cluster 2OG-Fe(II) oxygenase
MIPMHDELMLAAIADFTANGYTIVAAEDRAALDEVRAALHCSAAGTTQSTQPGEFMDRFHERGLKGSELNDFRLATYRDFNKRVDAGALIWKAFRNVLVALVGPDVSVQRQANLVIQPPHDTDNSPAHRDAPPNSLFEVVAWVPMVDCYGTKGMQVLDLRKSEEALKLLTGSSANHVAFSQFAFEHGEFVDVPYGSGLLFWTPLVHAIPVNVESQTRWSLNLRYKSVFTPYGSKGFPEYFRVLELSPLTHAAIEYERRARLGESPYP